MALSAVTANNFMMDMQWLLNDFEFTHELSKSDYLRAIDWACKFTVRELIKADPQVRSKYKKVSSNMSVSAGVVDLDSIIEGVHELVEVMDNSDDTPVLLTDSASMRYIVPTYEAYKNLNYCMLNGENLDIFTGSSASAPTNVDVYYIGLPTTVDATTDLIDVPEEYHMNVKKEALKYLVTHFSDMKNLKLNSRDYEEIFASLLAKETQETEGIEKVN